MKRAKNTLLFNILVIAVAVIYFVILAVGNVSRIQAKVAVVPGSYAAEYADKNKLTVAQLADSQQKYFYLKYELFDYSIDNRNRVQLEKYTGQSTNLVIPAYIDGIEVFSLSESFMKSLTTVKNLYLSNKTEQIYGEANKTIVIHCYDDNQFRKDNYDSEWNFETILDSDYVDFTLGDIPFTYNNLVGSYEIVSYTGNDDYIIIPSYINGYPVTNVSMNLLNNSKIVVIPETVTTITGTSAKLLYTPLFAIELIFTIAAFVLALIIVNMLLPRYGKSNAEYMLTGNQLVAAALYVIVQTAFSIYAIYFGHISAYLGLAISAVIFVVFLLTVFLGGIGRDHAVAVTENNIANTSRMDAIKASTKHLADDIKDPELKKQVQRLVDEIRYSDPVSDVSVKEYDEKISNNIIDLKTVIEDCDGEKIKIIVAETIKLVGKRESILKDNKNKD